MWSPGVQESEKMNATLRIDNCDEWSNYKDGDISGLKGAIFINDYYIN